MTTTSDKELLELAAKAAGYELGYVEGFNEVRKSSDWNPLTDDGDALRLAVKLDISVDMNRVDEVVTVEYGYHERKGLQESLEGDPYAATRRAIVRAAAEIGKTL